MSTAAVHDCHACADLAQRVLKKLRLKEKQTTKGASKAGRVSDIAISHCFVPHQSCCCPVGREAVTPPANRGHSVLLFDSDQSCHASSAALAC